MAVSLSPITAAPFPDTASPAKATEGELECLLTLNGLLKGVTQRGIDFWVGTYSYDSVVAVLQLLGVLDQLGYTLEEILPALKLRRQTAEYKRRYRVSHKDELNRKSAEKRASLPAEAAEALAVKNAEYFRAYRAANRENYNKQHAEAQRRYRARKKGGMAEIQPANASEKSRPANDSN